MSTVNDWLALHRLGKQEVADWLEGSQRSAEDQIDWDCLDIRVSEEQIELRADTDKFRWKIQRPNARLN